MHIKTVILVFTVLSIVAVPILALVSSHTISTKVSDLQEKMLEQARTLLKSFNDRQQASLRFPFDSAERMNWHYFPKSREGVPIKRMKDNQLEQGYALINEALTNKGYSKTTGIIELEDILRKLENRPPDDPYRDPGKYYFSLFGELKPDMPWGWRVEGHHLSLNFTVLPDGEIAVTPAFLGTDPAIVPSGPNQGLRVLTREETLARQLVQNLDRRQQNQAIIRDVAPREILTGAQRTIDPMKPEGITAAEMSEQQKLLFMDLIHVYLDNFKQGLVQEKRHSVRNAEPDELYFAWAGGLQQGQGHYYRIQGPNLLIEYDNTQDNANHIHTVMRDPVNDFGRDMLRTHYAESDHHQHD